jgi:hypothetical protein
MDPTTEVKAIFGDLLMQIAILQAQLKDAQHQLAIKEADSKFTDTTNE